MSSCKSLSFTAMVLRYHPCDADSQTNNQFAWSGSRGQGKCSSAVDHECEGATMIIADARWTT